MIGIPPPQPAAGARWAWPVCLSGLWLFVFGALGLSGPGRIDIIDGQVRYAAAESLYEHGDSVIRDPDIDFHIFPGRDGRLYTPYRWPQTVLGVAAIWFADRLGPPDEGRRHFLFVLTSAAAAGLAAVGLADWFYRSGLSARRALGWAAAGVFCTPVWFYGTSTFDDILGTTGVVLGLAAARRARDGSGWGWAVVAALVGIWVVNCKPPLGLFLVGFLGVADNRARGRRHRVALAAVVASGMFAGAVIYKGYELYKFPPGTDWLPSYIAAYGPIWTSNPVPGICSFLFSPGAGVFWYCPPFLLACIGLGYARGDREARWAVALGAAGFTLSICYLTFFKGTPGWGPRYLVPVFAATWLYAPAGAALLTRRLVAALLAVGLAVQVLGLSVDPLLKILTQGMPFNYYLINPWTEFGPQYSDLPQRPRQIYDILQSEPRTKFNRARNPTHILTPLYGYEVPEYLAQYYVVNGFRPWLISYQHLAAEQRPVPYWGMIGLFGGIAAAGVGLIRRGLRPARPGRLAIGTYSKSSEVQHAIG